MVAPLVSCSILVFAEEPFSLHCLEALLKDAGADVIATASPEEALDFLGSQQPSACVLDVGTGSNVPQPIVGQLQRLGVPCVLCMNSSVEENAPGVFVLSRPVRGTELIEMLSRVRADQLQVAGAVREASRRSSTEIATPLTETQRGQSS